MIRNIQISAPVTKMAAVIKNAGSGKSTLLNILGGLDVPTSGQVWYLDHNLTEAEGPVLSDTSDRGSP
ncbi:MAG TPA: ATP-binding cassette domain-containing protein [Candidatus Acidoferrales bacterium]